MILEVVYIDPELKRQDMYQTTVKGEAVVNLDWLSPENDPKPRKPYPLSDEQVDILCRLYKGECNPLFKANSTCGAWANNFYRRLEKRGLITAIKHEMDGRRHRIYWQLTHKGRSIASGLSDLPF